MCLNQIWTKYQKEDINQKSKKGHLKTIKLLYKSREAVIKLFNDYSSIISEAKYRTKHGEGLKISIPKQMLQRLPIAVAKVKTDNTSENLLNEIGPFI